MKKFFDAEKAEAENAAQEAEAGHAKAEEEAKAMSEKKNARWTALQQVEQAVEPLEVLTTEESFANAIKLSGPGGLTVIFGAKQLSSDSDEMR